MPKIHPYHVIPTLPERIEPLSQLAYNLRWAWDHETIELFRRLDRDLWESSGHNPVLMLGAIPQEILLGAAKDEAFLAHMDRVYKRFTEYVNSPGWFVKNHPEFSGLTIAYFSAEFGITECLPIYAGGLGILAGDHLKSASDLGLPLIGVGLLYQEGYFRQYLNADGWQQETYPENDFYNLPVRPVHDSAGDYLKIHVDFPGRKVQVKIWRADVGRVPLVLLDTNIPENSPQDRDITDALYGGDREMRIRQEIILGIGGIRALTEMGINPTVCHMNEGHPAFLAPERARLFMEKTGLTYREARQATCAGNVFTTHTPVAAGFDLFEPWLVHKYFNDYAATLGLAFDHFISFGRYNIHDPNEPLNMAVLASKHCTFANGVSRLHGEVTRQMAKRVWSKFPDSEIPVGHVTNGVHIPSWISLEMSELLNRYLGPKWTEDPANPDVWNRIDEIPDEELWRTHERRKERLIAYARRRLVQQLRKRGISETEIITARSVLNSEFLTIGFARRFATYKRATLLLKDLPRLKKIITDGKKPVQILFAGKAHPRDEGGKELIRRILQFKESLKNDIKIAYLENYDMQIGKLMTSGVDIWLNTPQPPMEASGTSGMKAALNGVPSLSILDGWWIEGHIEGITGWSIGEKIREKVERHDSMKDAVSLLQKLEEVILPLFYNHRDQFVELMRHAITINGSFFNTQRMVQQYVLSAYFR